MVIEEQISSVSRPPKAHGDQQAPAGCTTCSLHRPGWFCSLGGAALAELERASSAISLPPQASLFKQGAEALSLYILCAGYVKLMAGQKQNREMIVRVAGPGSVLGLYAALTHGIYEVSAESLSTVHLRAVERERFLSFQRTHKEAEMRATQSMCQEYRFALEGACRIALSENVAARLGKLLLDLAHQIGERMPNGEFRFPLLLTHEELASMTSTTRETVTRTLSHFRQDGSITIEDSVVTVLQPSRLQVPV